MSQWKEYTNDADPAHSAAEKGDLEAVESYLSGEGAEYLKRVFEREIHINSTVTDEGNRGGWTLIFCAAMSGDPDIVKYLIEKGADVGIHDVYNQTCLAYAKGATVRTIIKNEQVKREKRDEHRHHMEQAWKCISKHEEWGKTLQGLRLRMVQENYAQEQRLAQEAARERQRQESVGENEGDIDRPASAGGGRSPLDDEEGEEGSPESALEKLQKSIDYTYEKCVQELDAVTEHVVKATEAAEYFERLQVAYAGCPLQGEEKERATAVFLKYCGDGSAVAGPEQLEKMVEAVLSPKALHLPPKNCWPEARSLKMIVKFGGIEDDPVMYLPEFLTAFVAFSLLVSASAINIVADAMLEAQAKRELADSDTSMRRHKFADAREALERAHHWYSNLSYATVVRGKDGQPEVERRSEVVQMALRAEELEAQSKERLLMEANLHNAALALEDYVVFSRSFFKREEGLARLAEAKTFVEEARKHFAGSGAGPELSSDVIKLLFRRRCAEFHKEEGKEEGGKDKEKTEKKDEKEEEKEGGERLPRHAAVRLLAEVGVKLEEDEQAQRIEGDLVPLETVLQVYHSEHARIWTKRTKEELEQARERVKRYGKEAESYAQGTAAYDFGHEDFEEHNYLEAKKRALEADELFEQGKTKDYRMLCQEFATRSEEAHVHVLRSAAYASLLQAEQQRRESLFRAARTSVEEARQSLGKTGRGEEERMTALDDAARRINEDEQRENEEAFVPRILAQLGAADSLLFENNYSGGLDIYRECVNRGEDFLDDFPQSTRVQQLQARVHARCSVAYAALGTLASTETCHKHFEKARVAARECLSLDPDWPEGLTLEGAALAGAGHAEEAAKALERGLTIARKGGGSILPILLRDCYAMSGSHRRMAVLYVLATGGMPESTPAPITPDSGSEASAQLEN